MRYVLVCIAVLAPLVCFQARVIAQESQESPATAQELLRRAENCLDRYDCGDVRGLRELLQKALELDPTLAEAYLPLSMLYSINEPKAMEICQRMVEVFPEDARSYICMYRRTDPENIDELERWARKAVEVGPDNAKARFLLADLLYHRKYLRHRPGGKPPVSEQDNKDLDEAIAHFRVGIRLDAFHGFAGENSDLNESLFFMLGIAGAGNRFAEAADLLIVLIEGSGGNLRNKGWCGSFQWMLTLDMGWPRDLHLYDHEDFQPAMAKIREHCENPDLERAFTLQKEGRASQAIAAWESIMDKEIFAWDVFENLPRLYYQTGHPDKGRALVLKHFEAIETREVRCDTRAKMVAMGYTAFYPDIFDQLEQECSVPTR